ncbi:MAG TPA: ribokinase, partial [Acidimicrobiales bacterium]
MTIDRPPAGVVVVGSVNMDITVEVEHLPRPGETLLATGTRWALGGKGANQAVAAARQGLRTAFVGAVGDDSDAAVLRDGLGAEDLDLAALRRVAGTPSGRAFITVAADGANTVLVAPGANRHLTADDVADAATMIRPGAVVLAQLEISDEAVMAALRAGRAAGATTVLNPAPARPLDPELLALCDVLVPNETEAAALSGVADPAAGADALARIAPATTIIVTRGELGALVRLPGGPAVPVPAIPVTAVDTVAAGDAFCGVLAAALSEGRPLADAVRRAVAAG